MIFATVAISLTKAGAFALRKYIMDDAEAMECS